MITEIGVWVGLAHNNTRGFQYPNSSPAFRAKDPPEQREWTGTNVFVDYHGSSMQGTALFDTGNTQSYLSAAVSQECHRLLAGDQYTIKIGNDVDQPIETLHMTVDDFTKPITAPYVRVSPREPVFVNTCRFFYHSFDLLFDADGGWLGFRRREARKFSNMNRPSVEKWERISRPGTESRDSDEEP